MSLEGFDPEDLFIRGVVTGNLANYLAGRTDEIELISNRLAATDQSCVIYGERGIGKTTIARQVVSILSGDNPVFDRNAVLTYGSEKAFRPCLARVSEEWETVGDLLLECVTVDGGPDSFVGRYKEALTNKSYVSEFSTKFGFNIASIFTGEVGAKIGKDNPLDLAKFDQKLQSTERVKRRVFQEFIQRAKLHENLPDAKIIFFVDEMDRKPNLRGLGAALKDINDVQFCFIGIADTIDAIVSDHESAGRKLTGGGVKVPALSDNEINWIFDNASAISGNHLKFTEEFRLKALQYAEGMPWIAQHLGYEAVFSRLGPARRRKEKELTIDVSVFDPAMTGVIDLYRKTFNEKFDLERVIEASGMPGLDSLRALLKAKSSLTELEIKNSFPIESHKNKRWATGALKKMTEVGILVNKSDKYSISSALLRIFIRYYLDKYESEVG